MFESRRTWSTQWVRGRPDMVCQSRLGGRPHIVPLELVSPPFSSLYRIAISPQHCSRCERCMGSDITHRSFPRKAFPREDAQGYVSARCDSRAETYPCASSRGNASRGKDRRVISDPVLNSLRGWIWDGCVYGILRTATVRINPGDLHAYVGLHGVVVDRHRWPRTAHAAYNDALMHDDWRIKSSATLCRRNGNGIHTTSCLSLFVECRSSKYGFCTIAAAIQLFVWFICSKGLCKQSEKNILWPQDDIYIAPIERTYTGLLSLYKLILYSSTCMPSLLTNTSIG